MKVVLAEHFGMCFGVRDAIAEAERLAAEAPLTILGALVHNPLVREQLRQHGAREHTPENSNPGTKRVMITAHGTSDRKREEWKAGGFEIADGTCPLVRHAHTQLRELVRAGYFPVVIGKANHVEVIGLTGDFPEAKVIDELPDIARLPLRERFGVIAQTTQPIVRVEKFVAAIEREWPNAEVRFVDTVCRPTKDRQRALLDLIARTQLVIVVGGRASNNTQQLVETCRIWNRRVIQVEQASELRREWFADIGAVGVTAGTSTLPDTVAEVQRWLNEFAAGS